jgi:parallel beta-helix repeat protein
MQNVYDSTLKDNSFSAYEDALEADLVSASYCYNVGFKNNTVSNSLKSGLRVSNASEFTVSGNTFSGNSVCAVVMGSAADSSISKNTVSDSGTGGIKIGESCSKITCTSNVVKSFGDYGIQVSGAGSGKDIKIKSNDFSGGSVGISCVSSGKAYLFGNSFEAVSDKVYASEDGLITLAAAKNFTAEEVTENKIKITWNPISEADGIYVYRRTAGMADFELIATVDSGSIFQDERLISGTNYFYKIVPFITVGDNNCNNTESQEIAARTKINISTAYVDCVSEAAFTAKPVTPDFTVTAYSRQLVAGTDYDYKYENNLYTGTAVISITGRGDYVGSLSYSFEINLTAKRVSNVSRNAIATAPFAQRGNVSFDVSCTSTGGMLLADSDVKLTQEERTINGMLLQVPVSTSVSGMIWSGDGYTLF